MKAAGTSENRASAPTHCFRHLVQPREMSLHHCVAIITVAMCLLLPGNGSALPLEQTSDCNTVCNQMQSSFGGNFEKCLIVCCMEADLNELIRLREKHADPRMKREALAPLRTRHGQVTGNDGVLSAILPKKTNGEASSRLARLAALLDQISALGIGQNENSGAEDDSGKQNENYVDFGSVAYDGNCERYVSVLFERQVDKMSVMIPQKRRWGSTIGLCINAHCGGVNGPRRVSCIVANCHRNRRSGAPREKYNYISYHTGDGVGKSTDPLESDSGSSRS